MAGNANFDEILSTTLNNYIPKLTDNIFTARPLFYALTNGQTIRRVSGGAKIVVPLIYGTNSSAGSYSGTDTIATTAQTGITAAEYDLKQYAAAVTLIVLVAVFCFQSYSADVNLLFAFLVILPVHALEPAVEFFA